MISNLILGYTDQGRFDADAVTDNLQWWLDEMQEQISTLSLNFTPAAPASGAVTAIEPGVPYIVKWPIPDGMTADEFAADNTKLYLGEGNTLYYPTATDFAVKSCRGYFELKNGLTAGEPSSATVRAFSLNFGEGSEETGIVSVSKESGSQGVAGAWFSMDGVRLDITPERALDIFYTSKTNERLHDPSTLLYTFGDRYIVDDVIREIQN